MNIPPRPSGHLSETHRDLHARTLNVARTMRASGGAHARLLAYAAASRQFYAALRQIGA